MMAYRSWFSLILLSGVLAGCDASDSGFEGAGIVVAVSGSASSYAYARYSRPAAASARCPAPLELGACTYVNCFFFPEDEIASVEVGPITIQGGSREITLEPSDYGSPEEPEALFSGDEMLTFDVAGSDTVGAHTAEVRAPVPATITSPVFGEPIELDRAQDFPITWTGGAGAYMQLSVTATVDGEVDGELHRVAFSCRVPVDSDPDSDTNTEEALLPKSLINALPEVSDPAQATLTVGPWSWNAGSVDGWNYYFYATASEASGITIVTK